LDHRVQRVLEVHRDFRDRPEMFSRIRAPRVQGVHRVLFLPIHKVLKVLLGVLVSDPRVLKVLVDLRDL
jgi:hypothetical protein